jgi:thiol-disulfide isomerase/thioredoxin
MKSLTYTVLSALFLLAIAAFRLPGSGQGEVVLTCNLNSCDKVDSIFLFEFNGINFKKIQAAPTQDWQTYQFKMPATGPRFYYVGQATDNLKPLILGTEKDVKLNGTCRSFQGARLANSDLNKSYEALKAVLNKYKNEFGQSLQQFQAANAQNNIDLANSIVRKLGKMDDERLHLIDSLKKESPYLAKIAALNTYLSYQNHGSGDYTEIEYFATHYFHLVDWKDPGLHYMPWVYEGLKGFAQTLASVNMPDAKQKHYLDLLLSQIPGSSRTYMLALGGVIAGLQAKKSPLIKSYAQRYAEKYKNTEPEAVAKIQQLLNQSATFSPGGEAPGFTMNTPDGNPLSLQSLRGKVVLIDFWASWCGPCRRENPHVVAAYQQYHGKGFDVLGVSLDKTKDRWLAAIEKDGLIWHHVSDLKGWQNAAAQLYGVRSIPHTVLLDREGKIIARGLRGAALTAKLDELFGG